MSNTAFHQVWSTVERVRLQSFVFGVLSTVLVMTVAIVKPILHAIFDAIEHIVTLDGWSSESSSSIQWNELWEQLKEQALTPLWTTLSTLIGTEWKKVEENPLKIVVNTSLFVALILVALLPAFEKSRAAQSLRNNQHPTSTLLMEDDAPPYSSADASAVSSVGASSATRLDLLSRNNAVERTLERWRMMQPRNDENVVATAVMENGAAGANFVIFLRRLSYAAVSAIVLLVPLVLHWFIVVNANYGSGGERTNNSWFVTVNMAVMLFYTHTLSTKAMRHTTESTRFAYAVSMFLRSLSNTVKEVSSLRQSPQADLQRTATVSPTDGISVTDLWAAHSAKRAWAVKGANVYCRSGEVVLLLGDDGSGKTRFLTAIGEHILCPVKRARSTTYVRGSISVGGLETPKWDRMQLRKRIGLVLNDVRTVGDTAELFSGCTLEEILEPLSSGAGGAGSSGASSEAREKSAINVSMQITGLSSTLLPKLPSKLSTVIAANEDELSPSKVRPPSYPLSPTQWSKVLLTRILAQTIVCNDNPISSPNAVAGCMVGSVLLLDDVTAQLSEVDEAKLIETLRSTGAAVLLASNRWASGRFADRIVVIKDGSVVESGTHSELISLGSQESTYAAKWSEFS